MKETDVRANAFAMPLASPAFPPGPYRLVNREYLIITYRTDPERLRAVVPEPLEVTEPVVNTSSFACRTRPVSPAAELPVLEVLCPGFVRTPLVDKQIPEQAKELGITEAEVVKNVMLKETVDGEFTTVQDVAEAALFFAAFESNALTGQSLVVSHGWFMQ
jgi:hypothetical protein